MAARWPVGSGFVSFLASDAAALGFHAHHEPEHDNDAHANVYCDHPPSRRKTQARQLAAACVVRAVPTPP